MLMRLVQRLRQGRGVEASPLTRGAGIDPGIGFVDEFDQECNMIADKWGTQSRYREWANHMKVSGQIT